MVDGPTKDRGTNIYIYMYVYMERLIYEAEFHLDPDDRCTDSPALRDILLTRTLPLFPPRQMIYFALRSPLPLLLIN